MALQISRILYTLVLRAKVCTTFSSHVDSANFCTKVYKIREICVDLYIFRILEHFATKLCNFTNFKMLLIHSCSDGFCSSCLDQNLVYSWNHPLYQQLYRYISRY